ncbi:MAG: hypothetical protein ACREQ7_24695 [Candidatus Binatia bacterium]
MTVDIPEVVVARVATCVFLPSNDSAYLVGVSAARRIITVLLNLRINGFSRHDFTST